MNLTRFSVIDCYSHSGIHRNIHFQDFDLFESTVSHRLLQHRAAIIMKHCFIRKMPITNKKAHGLKSKSLKDIIIYGIGQEGRTYICG